MHGNWEDDEAFFCKMWQGVPNFFREKTENRKLAGLVNFIKLSVLSIRNYLFLSGHFKSNPLNFAKEKKVYMKSAAKRLLTTSKYNLYKNLRKKASYHFSIAYLEYIKNLITKTYLNTRSTDA